jgi:hypothetical protein
MRVRCRALPDARSNAVGSLELECRQLGLIVSFVEVLSYREGEPSGERSESTRLCIPWPRVRAARIGSEHLRLAFDERFTPRNRFYLSRFELADQGSGNEPGGERRLGVRLLGKRAPSRWILTELCDELSRRLLRVVPVEPETRPGNDAPRRRGAFDAELGRSALGVGLILALVGLTALASSRALERARVRTVSDVEPPRATLETVVSQLRARAAPAFEPQPAPSREGPPEGAPLPPTLPTPEAPTSVSFGARCDCVRSESVLWQRPPPRLTLLVADQQQHPRNGRPYLDVQIAAINNGAHKIQNLELRVVFERDADREKGEPALRTVRDIKFDGTIRPGHVVKWKVDGPGERCSVRGPSYGRLDEDGSDAAPADAFDTLASTEPRKVRIHASLLLAFLGDVRAHAHAAALRDGAPPAEAAFLERILAGSAELEVCELTERKIAASTRLRGCIYNAGDRPVRGLTLGVRELALARDPGIVTSDAPLASGERRWPVVGELGPHRGRHIDLLTETSAAGPGRAIELIVLPPEGSR